MAKNNKSKRPPLKPVLGLKRADLLNHVMSRCNMLSGDRAPDIHHYLSTGSTLVDLAISEGLGLPGGKVCEIVGREGSSKTGFTLQIAKVCQAMGGYVVWFDLETGFSVGLAEDVVKCPISKPTFNYVCPDYGDDALHLIELLCKEHTGSETAGQTPLLIVVDSIPSIIGKGNAQKSIKDTSQKASGAALLSQFFSRPWKQRIQGSNIFIVLINQVRSTLKSMSNSDEEYTTPGGHAIPFYAHTRLDLRRESVIWDDDEAPRSMKFAQGIMVRCTVSKAKHTMSYDSITYPFYTRSNLPVSGLDDIRSCLTFLSARDALDRKGAWYSLGTEFKAQGLDNFWHGIVSCPDYSDIIRDLTREVYLNERGIELDFGESTDDVSDDKPSDVKKE